MSGPYLRVALDTPLRALFDYRPPAGEGPRPAVGCRVRVPFGARRMVGIVVELAATSAHPPEKLKAAIEVLDAEPLYDRVLFELIRWAAEYYHHPVGEVFAAAMPVGLREGKAAVAAEQRWRLSPDGLAGLASNKRLGARQRDLLQGLAAKESFGANELAALPAATRATLLPLLRRGWIESYELLRAEALPDAAVADGPVLGAAQQTAIDAIAQGLGSFTPFLLHGVTGSGKTEVYLRAIAAVLQRGEQALVLVPEIGLTPQLIARFRSRIAAPLAVLHSGLSDTERLAAWRAARAGTAGVVIGTRSAVFTPLARPGLIVIDEEHDGSFKQQEGFRYSARDLGVIRAQRHGIPVVLGSATPSLETLQNVKLERYQNLALPERAGVARKPRVAIIDLRVTPMQQGIATPVVMAIERHLAAGGQALVYLNRRGYSPSLFCAGCGWAAPCSHCDARLTVHMQRARLVCHHCGNEEPIPYACPVCGTEVRPVGSGTERVETALGEMFPGVAIVRIDRDTVRRKGDMDAVLERVAGGDARILVGTQMLAKGHDFPDVTLVAVLNADHGLFGVDFRASERLAQTIVQVAGRAGRASRPGEVLIQTLCPEHPLLLQLLNSGYEGFAAAALAERELAAWPPFSRLAALRADSSEAGEALAFLAAARTAALDLLQDVRLLGPAPATMERRAGRYRAQLLAESRNRSSLQRMLTLWVPRIVALPTSRHLKWNVDVDPLEAA